MKSIIMIIAGILLIILVNASTYQIDETEQVIITQFGEPIGDAIKEPGIHFKLPIIQNANFFDKRFLEWNGDPNEVTTLEKTYIYVDTYARWRIVNPLLFFQKVRDERGAQSRLDDILDGETRIAIANNKLAELVRSSNREFAYNEDAGKDVAPPKINKGRAKIIDDIIRIANDKTVELGIEILDLRIKRLKYRDDVLTTVYNRMISERQKISDKFLSEGQGEAQKILGNKERELKNIYSGAFKEAETIRGTADGKATAIYAQAYNGSADSRNFYEFLKTMESYKKTLSEKDLLVLSTKSDYFKFINKKD
jgi:modulator of FtsH protease HflC